MAVVKGPDRSSEFAAMSENTIQDYDPEGDELATDDESDNDSQDDGDLIDGREHYVPTTESKLRKPKETLLGPQYRGSRISRNAMVIDEDDDENNPFNKNFDDEDSDDAAEGLEELDGASDEEMLSDSEQETDDTEFSDEDEDEMQPAVIDKAELRKAMAAEQGAVAAAISAANQADAEKGRAVMQQRATFDALLNARIKLQKSLISTNSIVALDPSQLVELRTDHETTLEKAESAALNLWNTLTSFREELNAAKTGEKRKAPQSASLQAMFQLYKSQEESVVIQRNAILQKWSMKSCGVSATPQRGRLNNEQPATIVDVLNEHLASSERLLKRARTPRSCAPVQLGNRVTGDVYIYDDADFYGLLLKELLEAKSSAQSAAATNVDLSSFANIRRDAKTRKNVDTKASKGRKLRYTVHEKLQNYCAPEDRTTWGERQVDELFTSLFGQNAGLDEDRDQGRDVDMDDADAGLIMFKT